jgi:ribonuclease BN (tRNA processing enzyme)
VRLTVLGKSPSWPDAGGACSGYLVQDGDTSVLLDCGNGVFGKLREVCDYGAVDAVVISHLHADHILDLVPFAYGLTYAPGRGNANARPVLHAPAGAGATLRRIAGAWGNEDLVEGAFDLREYAVEDVLGIGTLQIRFTAVPHYVPTHAIEVRAPGGGRLTYGADHRPSPELVTFARDTDLLLIEASIPEPEPDEPRGHLTPAEAGDHARRAGARRVLLTHISDELDPGRALEEAGGAFGAPVEIARGGAVYEI